MRRASLAAIAAMALAACQDLPDVATGLCGNGVVEPGEDCEATATDGAGNVVRQCGASDGANACFFECVVSDVEAERVACPVDFTCGADNRCRQAAGRFDTGASLTLAVDDVKVGDIDGDGFDDLVTGSGSTIRVSFGSSQADLASSLFTPVSTPELALEVGDLDADGFDDILVATEPGVQAFLGADDRSLDPFSYPLVSFSPGASIAHAVADNIDPSTAAQEVLIAWGTRIGFAAMPGGTPTTAVADLPAPGVGVPLDPGLAAPLAAARLSSNRAQPSDVDLSLEVAIGYESRSTISIYRASAGPLTMADTGATIALGAGVELRPGSGMFFGYFDGDGCLDLIAHVGGVGGERVLVFRGTLVDPGGANTCTGVLQTPGQVVVTTTADPQARVFAAADFDGNGTTDLVLNSGIYLIDGTGPWTPRQVTFAHPGFEGAHVVDLNGDGKLDVAAFREGLPDVEVLINADGVFNRFVVTTANSVQRLAGGDFDGDLTGDLAIVELDSSGDEQINSVSVSFGTFLGPPGPRVVMDRFPPLAGVAAASVIGSSGTLDAVDDLVVLQQSGASMDATVLFGSGARAMTSPLTLQSTTLENPTTVAIGSFGDDAIADLFTIGNDGTAFSFQGDGDGGFAEADTGGWITGFDAGDALWASGDIDGDGDQELVAVERFERRNVASLVDVLLFEADQPAGAQSELGLDTLEGFIGAHALWLADLEGDGDLDLVLGLDPPLTDLGASGLRIGWNDGNSIDGLSGVAGGEGCFDVVALQLDADAEPELIALCRIAGRGQLGLRRFDTGEPETLTSSPDLLADIPGDRKTRLRVGDFDGDGLSDLAVLIQGGETADVRILLQRDIHAQP